MMMPEGCVGKHCYRACYQDEVLIYACYTNVRTNMCPMQPPKKQKNKKVSSKIEIVLEILHCM